MSLSRHGTGGEKNLCPQPNIQILITFQARYVRYVAKIEPDAAVNDAFRNRLRKIAAHITLKRTDLARYESQLLVRDFGTHVITSLDVGAALVQVSTLKSFNQLTSLYWKFKFWVENYSLDTELYCGGKY